MRFTTKWGNIPRGRVDRWKHEDRPSPGCESLLSSRTLRCGYHDRVLISRPNSFLGSHHEWNQQIRDRHVRRNSCYKNRGTGKPVAKPEPWPKPTLTLSPVSIPFRERKWIDINPGTYSQGCFEVSKFVIRLLRHDESVPREDDGAVRFDDLAEKIKAQFNGTSQWTTNDWIIFLAKGGILPNISCTSEQSRDFQEVISFIRHCKTMYCYRMTSPSTSTTSGTLMNCTPSVKVDWFPEEKVSKETCSPCFSQPWTRCTLVQEKVQYDLDKPRIAVYKNTCWAHQTTVLWCNLKLAQRKGLPFHQTRSHAIALFNTLPDLYWESGIHEDWRGVILQGIFIPKVTASRAHAEYAVWTSGSASSRCEKIRPPSKRTKRVQGNLSLTSRGQTSQASRRKSAMEVQGNLSR